MIIVDFILGFVAIAGYIGAILLCGWLSLKLLPVFGILYIILCMMVFFAFIMSLKDVLSVGEKIRENIVNKISKK